MATQHGGDPPGRPTANALRVAFIVVTVLSLVLGYLGFASYLSHSTEYGSRPLDLLYYDLQLFVLGADPLQQGHRPFPAALEFARFSAPAATVYALFELGLRLFATEIRRVRARTARGHVIVSGEGAIADTLTRRLRTAGRSVVTIRPSAEPAVRATGEWLTVSGDARNPAVLRAAGIARARALYACDAGNSATNAAVAFAAASTRSAAGSPLSVYVNIGDPELCLTLQARYLGLDHPAGLRLDFFNIDDVAARMLFARERLRPVDGRPPRIVVVGVTAFGRAVIVEAARSWKAGATVAAGPLPVTVVDDHAHTMVDGLVHRYPFLGTTCRLTPHDADLSEMLVKGYLRDPPDRAFICHDDEDHALKTATAAERFWRSAPQSIIVRLDPVAAFQDDTGKADGRLFNEVDGRVRVFGVVSTACQPDLIGDDLVGRIARVIHERYRLARQRDGDNPGTNPSMVAWEELPEHLRESNRRHARDIGHKLSEIHCVLIPRVDQDRDGVLNDDEIERLAQLEHGRWHDDRKSAGWRYSDRADAVGKLHPGLRSWHDLPDPLRRRNHDMVRDLPAILSDVGFQIVHR
jgi:hypothetical protein